MLVVSLWLFFLVLQVYHPFHHGDRTAVFRTLRLGDYYRLRIREFPRSSFVVSKSELGKYPVGCLNAIVLFALSCHLIDWPALA